ncbi:MAG: F0F1 ATP synthase subunit delta [Acidiferrobacterales bacterium]
MAETKTLARPYAEAVFSLAKERDELDKWSDMLGLMGSVVTDERVARLTDDPQVTRDYFTGLLLDIGGDRLTADGKNFVRLLVDNDRIGLLPDIVMQFEQFKAEAEGIVEVEAVAAFKLDKGQMANIEHAMKKKLGREVRLTATVDKSLIGGVIIRAGDLVIDGSVTARLRELASQLNQ